MVVTYVVRRELVMPQLVTRPVFTAVAVSQQHDLLFCFAPLIATVYMFGLRSCVLRDRVALNNSTEPPNEYAHMVGAQGMCLTPDNNTLLAVYGSLVVEFDFVTSEIVRRLGSPFDRNTAVDCNSNFIVTVTQGPLYVKMYSWRTGECCGVLQVLSSPYAVVRLLSHRIDELTTTDPGSSTTTVYSIFGYVKRACHVPEHHISHVLERNYTSLVVVGDRNVTQVNHITGAFEQTYVAPRDLQLQACAWSDNGFVALRRDDHAHVYFLVNDTLRLQWLLLCFCGAGW